MGGEGACLVSSVCFIRGGYAQVKFPCEFDASALLLSHSIDYVNLVLVMDSNKIELN